MPDAADQVRTAEIGQTLASMVNGFLAMLPLLLAGAVAFVLFWVAARIARRVIITIAQRRLEYPSAATAIGRLVYVALLLLGVLIAVTIAFPSMTPARLFSVLGIGGVAIGFAFKDIFQNLLAGILLLIRHPFRPGDEISTGAFTGTVESIESRATFIRTYDGRRVIVPDSAIYTEPVTVISAYDVLRSDYDVGIGYGDDVGCACEVALRALCQIDGVLDEPGPEVLLWDLAGSSKNLRMRWWTKPQRAVVVRTRHKVLKAVSEVLSNAGIDLPFPTQVVLLHDQTEASDGDRTAQREGWPAGDRPPAPRPLNHVTLIGRRVDQQT